MKAFATSTFLFLLAATKLNAAPTNNARQVPEVTITFEGAADASFTLVEPADGSTFWIHNPLSISHIMVSDDGETICTFNGVDGSVTTVFGDNTVDVGPPQTQISGSCSVIYH